MKRSIFFTLISIILLASWADNSSAALPGSTFGSWKDVVDSQVLAAAQNGDTDFLVVLKEQADLSYANTLKTKEEKGAYVYQTLSELAAATQKPLREFLDSHNVTYHPFWVVNMLWVRGDMTLIQQIAQRQEIAHIAPNPAIQFSAPQPDLDATIHQAFEAIEWNINKINAPAVWNLGFTGEGIVIGGQDTGYDWDHPALKDKYRGWNGVTSDHNYNWHDTVTNGGGVCGPKSSDPCDDHGHGTHTMGTMVGDDGGANVIGVAPGAKWIGCRNMNVGVGTPASYSECYEWFIAPTDLEGLNPDPSKAPHVISNSWSCPDYEGCTDPDILLAVVQSVRAAGIVTVHAAGNEGSACSTVSEPAAIYAESFSVGATNRNDRITSFSSRGPVTVDGSNRLKPNVSAPGEYIRSSYPGGSYAQMSGTSMAAPHVAGLTALLLSADPQLIGQVDQIEDIIENSALPRRIFQRCGRIPGWRIPNNTYGWGRVDALAAVQAAEIISAIDP